MKVGVFAQRQVPTIDPEESIPLALWTMAEHHVHCLPVVQQGDIVGVVTDGELHFHGLLGLLRPTTLVRDLMGAKPVCCGADDAIEDVARRMLELGVRRAFVIWPNGRSVGEVSLGELAGGIGDSRLAARVISHIFAMRNHGTRPALEAMDPVAGRER